MNLSLVQALLAKKAFRQSTEIKAKVRVADIGGNPVTPKDGTFVILSAKRYPQSGRVMFEVVDAFSGRPGRVDATEIVEIDGMDPARYAKVYNLRDDGSEIPQGKQRGRPPKNRGTEPVDPFDEDDDD